MWYYVLWFFVCVVFFIISNFSIMFTNIYYNLYKHFKSFGVNFTWNVPPFSSNWKTFFMDYEHFVENDYKLRKKYPRERFVGRVHTVEPVIVLQDLVLIRKLTVKKFDFFVDRKVYSKDYGPFTSRCLYYLREKEWRDMRSTISPVFTTFRIKQMIPSIACVAEDTVKVLLCHIQASNDDYEVNVRRVAMFMVNDVIANCVYGMRISSIRYDKNEFYEMGNIIANDRNSFIPYHCSLTNTPQPFIPTHIDTPQIDVAQLYFYRLAWDSMNKRESSRTSRPDMLQLLVKARKGQLKPDDTIFSDKKEFGFASVPEFKPEKKRTQRAWTDPEFVTQVGSFHGDGYNTVVTALSFALHELALQPQIQERLVQEIKLQHNRNKGSVTFQSIQNMKYMDMVVSETLRLWPPIPYLERVCVKDFVIGKPNPRAPRDYMMKKGSRLWIPVWAIHRDPDLFPNPDKFDPERFSAQNIGKINPMAYMPFGSGPRNCIGSKFALCQLKIFLYYILLHTEVYPSKKTCIPSKLCPSSVDVRLKDGHTLYFKSRFYTEK